LIEKLSWLEFIQLTGSDESEFDKELEREDDLLIFFKDMFEYSSFTNDADSE
jgi:hypothetical protein